MNKKPKNKKAGQNRKRTLSRLMASQILYQFEFLKDEKKLNEVKEDVIENYLIDSEENPSSYREKIDVEFLDTLLSGITLDEKKLDTDVSSALKEGWKLEDLDDVLRQILRLGAFELKYVRDIPAKAVINEYVDLAAGFFEGKIITFVNAVLDGLAKKFRAEEMKK